MAEGFVATYLINAVWMALVVTGLATLLSASMKRLPPAYLHKIWVAALVCASLVPFATLHGSSQDGRTATAGSLSVDATPRLWDAPAWAQALAQRRPPSIPLTRVHLQVLCTLYGVFIAHRGVRLARAWRRATAIRSVASPALLGAPTAALVQRCCRLMGVRDVMVLSATTTEGPVVLGVRHPALVLPARLLRELNDEELGSVLCHELAHVRRQDFLFNIIYELILLPISFHPAARFVKARIDRSRELVCDELAADQCSTRIAYARSLLRAATSIAAAVPSKRRGYAMAFFDKNILEERIVSVLQGSYRRSAGAGWIRLGAASLVLVMACVPLLPLSVRVVRASGADPRLEAFAGTWESRFEGKVFLTLTLVDDGGAFSGTVSRTRIHVDAGGNLLDAQQQSSSDPASGLRVASDALLLVTTVKGRIGSMTGPPVVVPVEYEMRVTGKDKAELQIRGTPSDLPPAQAWTLKRVAAKP